MKRRLFVTLLAVIALSVAAAFIVTRNQQREAAGDANREAIRERQLANRLPDAAREALLNDSGLFLFSLQPHPRDDIRGPTRFNTQFHGSPILGETVVTSSSSRQALVGTLKRALAEWEDGFPMCFNPRHGLRATHNGHSFDFLICFECDRLDLYPETGAPITLGLVGEPGAFDDLLQAAGVPTSKRDK